MSFMINAKGLACPEPVILTKKALENNNDVTVLVDNTISLENIKRLASSSGCSIEVSEKDAGIFEINVKKLAGTKSSTDKDPDYLSCNSVSGPVVFAITSDTMGRGNDELGKILMKAFIHTVLDIEIKPDFMIFYNTGVKLTAAGSAVLDDLITLENSGVKILVCGTCVNYFELTGKVSAGIVSNMYDIAGTLSKAGRIVQP